MSADLYYTCVNPADVLCAETCISLDDCRKCGCTVNDLSAQGGPWGDFMDVFFCLFPIIVLVLTVTVPSLTLPTTQSLPLAAFLMFIVRLAYLGSDPLLTASSVIKGLLEAFTPLSIMAGAICLFETMEATLCMPFMMREIQALTDGHAVAELMLIFSFAYMVEGASGFGTPAALSAPMLVSRNYPKMESVVVVLIFNTFATVWGAVGTPLWFGFGDLFGKSDMDDGLLDVSYRAAIGLAASGAILMPFIVTILVPWKDVVSNLVFIYAAFACTVAPSVAIAFVNYEFPSLLGGMVGCIMTAILINFRVGLNHMEPLNHHPDAQHSDTDQHSEEHMDAYEGDDDDVEAPNGSNDVENFEEVQFDCENEEIDAGKIVSIEHQSATEVAEARLGPRKTMSGGYLTDVVMRTFPLWGVVVLLILTRIEQIGIKEHLTSRDEYFDIHFGTLGTFRLSTSIVLELGDILTYPNMGWKYEVLYIPFLVPFVFISVLTMILFRKDLAVSPTEIFTTTGRRLFKPFIALLGALVLVQLVTRTGELSPAYIIGTVLADWFQEVFVVVCPLLGALGSFFSGSTTVSNLTFGEIQKIAAESIGTSTVTMLALQVVGGSAGNGICLNNIIAACAVVGLNIGEGKILLRTYKYVFASTTIATVVMLALWFRF